MENFKVSEVVTYVESDYSKFSLIEGNRPILTSRVRKIVASIILCGFIKGKAIIVSSDLSIIDGQARFEACKKLGLPIYFQIVEGDKHQLMVAVNMQERLLPNDYLHMHATEGISNYKALEDFMKKNKLSCSTAVSIFINESKAQLTASLKIGNPFSINPDADFIMSRINECRYYVGYAKKVKFIKALMMFMDATEITDEQFKQFIVILGSIDEQANVLNFVNKFYELLKRC